MNVDHRPSAHVSAETPTLRLFNEAVESWIFAAYSVEDLEMTPTQMLLCMAASEATVTRGDGSLSLGVLLAPLHHVSSGAYGSLISSQTFFLR